LTTDFAADYAFGGPGASMKRLYPSFFFSYCPYFCHILFRSKEPHHHHDPATSSYGVLIPFPALPPHASPVGAGWRSFIFPIEYEKPPSNQFLMKSRKKPRPARWLTGGQP